MPLNTAKQPSQQQHESVLSIIAALPADVDEALYVLDLCQKHVRQSLLGAGALDILLLPSPF
jgi:hypothetical protein